MENFINNCGRKVLDGELLTKEEADKLLSINNKEYLLLLMHRAHTVRRKHKGDKIDLCALVNAKSGMCGEDCKFCAQSSHYNTECKVYPFMDTETIVKRAGEAKKIGAQRFCIVTSGGEVSDSEFSEILKAVKIIREDLNLEMDCSLGHLTPKRMKALKKAGVTRYNHNLETSPEYFKKICTTHTFLERADVVNCAKEHNMERCCGGIIGMGENSIDRLNLALKLREMDIECVPINILNPRPGTPLENTESIAPMEILKTVAVFRLILPKSTIKIAGGREHNLRSLQSMALMAGANGIIINGYLTTSGNTASLDFQMLKDLELDW